MTSSKALEAQSEALFLFDTTSAALWAEDISIERAIPAEVVPAPADSGAKCDLALRTRGRYAPALHAALEEEGVAFMPYPMA